MAGDKKPGSAMHLGAGALSGVTSCVLLQPFDLLKTRIQQSHARSVTSPTKNPVVKAIRSVVTTEGVLGLWRGTVPSLLRNAPGTSLYFYFLNHTKNMCLALENRISGNVQRTKLSSMSNMAVGASSRAMAGFLLMPGTLLKVHCESSLYKYAGIMGAAKEIWRSGGLRGFFVGAVPTAIRDAPYAGLYMLMYEAIKSKERDFALKRSVDLAETTVTMVAGVLAGLSASYLTQPFDLVKTRMQLRPIEYPTVLQSFSKIFREESFVGFFRGISLRVLRKGIQASLVFTLYEWVVRANTQKKSAAEASARV
ncbi:hypothetical protein H4217_004434 [Coemansia sp. RSA 1939]|nr:hypothetical protein H4217_004434 [Coemansia sp. RSA 1939]KAJ2610305.1 hypothetical protein EV177_004042 [Coemansia sp. RSA 1804]